MDDVCRRTPRLSFIDLKEVLIFGRFGRSHTDGAFATCHCMTLPESEPGYYFWRDRDTGQLTRRSEWFITKSPDVRIGGTQDQVSDLVRAPALLRSVARSIAQGRSLSGGCAGLAGQARHGRPRALSHRSGSGGHPQADPRRRQRLAALARAGVLRGGRRDGASLSRGGPGSRRSTISCGTTSPSSTRSSVAWSSTTFRNFPSFPQRYMEAVEMPIDPASGSSASSRRHSPCSTPPTISRCASSSTRRPAASPGRAPTRRHKRSLRSRSR